MLLALVSPLAYWAGTFIWVRVLQDILLGVVAPPLIVLGAPWLVLWRGLGRRGHPPGPRWPRRSASRWLRPDRPRLALSWPVTVTALFILVWCGWYVPGPVRRGGAPPSGARGAGR